MRKLIMSVVILVAALGALVSGVSRPALAATPAAHFLNAVACPGAKYCIAVGESVPAVKPSVPLASRWNGTKWAPLAVKLPAGAASGELDAISCRSVKYCFAVGDYETGSASSALAEIWNGTTWKVVKGPAGVALTAVSCGSTTSCLATGNTYTSSGAAGRTAHWNGTKWSVAKIAIPKGATGAAAGAVSCASASWCQVAVDSFVSKNLTGISDTPYVYTWNGKAWSAAKLALAAGTTYPQISDEKCLTTKDCVAVGESQPGTNWHTEAATFNGTKWSIKTLAGRDVSMSALACTAAKSCLSVGTQGSDAYGDGGRPYVERWNGASWKGAAAPAPAGKHALLSVVACASSSYCLTIGLTRTPGVTSVDFADLWTGKSWKLIPAP